MCAAAAKSPLNTKSPSRYERSERRVKRPRFFARAYVLTQWLLRSNATLKFFTRGFGRHQSMLTFGPAEWSNQKPVAGLVAEVSQSEQMNIPRHHKKLSTGITLLMLVLGFTFLGLLQIDHRQEYQQRGNGDRTNQRFISKTKCQCKANTIIFQAKDADHSSWLPMLPFIGGALPSV